MNNVGLKSTIAPTRSLPAMLPKKQNKTNGCKQVARSQSFSREQPGMKAEGNSPITSKLDYLNATTSNLKKIKDSLEKDITRNEEAISRKKNLLSYISVALLIIIGGLAGGLHLGAVALVLIGSLPGIKAGLSVLGDSLGHLFKNKVFGKVNVMESISTLLIGRKRLDNLEADKKALRSVNNMIDKIQERKELFIEADALRLEKALKKANQKIAKLESTIQTD